MRSFPPIERFLLLLLGLASVGSALPEPGYTAYDDGQYHDQTQYTGAHNQAQQQQQQPAPQTGWYQPISYTTYHETQPAGSVVTITSTVPCPISTTVVYDTAQCRDCCWDNRCCRNQFGGTCWYPAAGGGELGT